MKLVLTVESGGIAGKREYALEQGLLTLGREETCDVRFEPSEPEVSRNHAGIQVEKVGFRLTDHSSNGTHVNGKRVENVLLKSGDVVQLGPTGPRLRVRIDSLPTASSTSVQVPRPSLVDRSLYDPARDKGRRYSYLSVAVVLGMMVMGGFLGFLTLLLTAFELGPGAALVGVITAFAPAPIYLLIWLWLDRYDPEPAWVLGCCLVWGGGAATFMAGIGNTVFKAAMTSATGDAALAQLLSASISAPLLEEAAKGFAVLLVFLVLRREFDGVLDGIVYAGVIALGFAAVENVLYYGRSVAKAGAPGLFVVFVLRGVLGPFAHAVFTSSTGIGCGIARQTHNRTLRMLAPPLGYAGAVLLHFLWNTLASLSGGLMGILILYIVIWAPLFLVFFVAVVWMGHRESRLIRRMLEPEVALGLLTREQAEIAGSWKRRVAWLAATMGDLRRLGARRRFLHSATRLALCYWHAERATAAGGMTLSVGRIPGFRKDLTRLKDAI